MQNTYKSLTAKFIANHMTADKVQPATYWATIGNVEYRITAHRDTVEMANNTLASTLVLETPNERIVLRWDGLPTSIMSATIAA